MIYNNITFDGFHCRDDMCLIYVPADTKPIIAPQSVYSYTIGGMSGTAAYGDKQTAREYTLSGVFYPARDLRDEQEASTLWRRIAQWLGVGRRKLVFDSEPDKYIIAEVQSMDNDEYGWIDGGLQVTWLCQPYHWKLYPDTLEMAVPGQLLEAAASYRAWEVETSLPAPVDVAIFNDGAVTITEATVIFDGKRASFSGLTLLPGERLDVVMMPPIGAVITAADGTQRSAMEHMTTFEQLLATGKAWISCSVSYAEAADGGSALFQMTAHGCWR